jgi:hypothetical protein
LIRDKKKAPEAEAYISSLHKEIDGLKLYRSSCDMLTHKEPTENKKRLCTTLPASFLHVPNSQLRKFKLIHCSFDKFS